MGLVADTFGTQHVTWSSPLGVDAAAAKLHTLGLRPKGQISPLYGGSLRGKCIPPAVVAIRRTNFNHAWRPRLKGRLTADGDGSRLEARIGPVGVAVGFMVVWFTVLFVLVLASTVASIVDGSIRGLGPLLFLGFVSGLSFAAARASVGDRAFLRTTIARAINGTEIPTQGATT